MANHPAPPPAHLCPPALIWLAFGVLGFVGAMAGALVPALRLLLGLDLGAAMAAQWIVLAVGGAFSLPAAALMARLGMAATLVLAFATMAAGAALVAWAAASLSYAQILAAMGLLAIGATAVQVAGNPLAASRQGRQGAHVQLALGQAFNALGVLGGVHTGAYLMLGGARPPAAAAGVSQAYAFDSALALLAMVLFGVYRHRLPGRAAAQAGGGLGRALASRWAWAGALAIALYVGAEGAIGSILINFLHQPAVLGLGLAAAGRDVANIYWGGALAGRCAGSWLLGRCAPARLLAGAAGLAGGLCLTVALSTGALAGYAALAIGLCNAIMFPTIFSLTLERCGAHQAGVSGLLCTAIAGGALVSIAVGAVADHIGLSAAFGVPMLAYAAIAGFALMGRAAAA